MLIMPKIERLKPDGLLLFTPDRHSDVRGWFSETWREDFWQAAGVNIGFVQDNESFSHHQWTVRGLHFQEGSASQAKIVRVLRGRILDVAVDIRSGSPTFGQHAAVELGCEDGKQLLIPVGFAHGFCTLEPDTHVAYKVSQYYSPSSDRGIRWNDPQLGISWPVLESRAVLSEKDTSLPLFNELMRDLASE